jgi:hypothetical protein
VTIATGASAPLVAHDLRTRPPDAHARPLPAAPRRAPEPKPVAAATQAATVAAAVVTPPAPVEREAEDRHDGRSGGTGERGEANEGSAAVPAAEVEDRSPSSGRGGAKAPAAVVVTPESEPDEHGGASRVSGDGESGDGELGD